MRKHLIALSLVAACTVSPALAATSSTAPAATPTQPAAAPAPLTPEQQLDLRKKALNQQLTQWNAMSKDKKLAFLNEQHDRMLKNFTESWAKLSDANKISQHQQALDMQKKQLGVQ